MTDKEIEVGDLVWAKMVGWSPWPGKVTAEIPSKRYRVTFFGTKNYAWMAKDKIKEYEKYKDQLSAINKTVLFKQAVAEIENYIERKAAGEDVDAEFFPDEDEDLNGLPEDAKMNDSSSLGSEDKEDVKPPLPKKGRKVNAASPAESLAGPSRRKKKSIPNGQPEPAIRKLKFLSLPPVNGARSLDSSPSSRRSSSSVELERPSTSKAARMDNSLVLEPVSKNIQIANISPSNLKFGFLGLGTMGRAIVKNLLGSGHKVIIWNRSPAKYKDFIEGGAEVGNTPADVVSSADITFCCVADAEAVKEVAFSTYGALQEIYASKSYVELTGIDTETAKDMEEVVTSKGGRYLQAQLQGGQQEAENGQLVILCSGDESLYKDCLGAFATIGKHSFFLDEKADSAAKMNLVIQLISGVMIGGLSEGIALADSVGLEMKDVLDVMGLSNMACPLLLEKGASMMEDPYKAQKSLKHLQKDFNLALEMGYKSGQPLQIAAVANQSFQEAKRAFRFACSHPDWVE